MGATTKKPPRSGRSAMPSAPMRSGPNRPLNAGATPSAPPRAAAPTDAPEAQDPADQLADELDAQRQTDENPPRPRVPERVKKRVDRLWDETNDVPDFKEAVKAFREAQKDLFPAQSDPSDPFRGRVPREQRRKKDDRRVNVPLGYNAVTKTVAMTVPEDSQTRWKARRMVSAMDQVARRIGPDPFLKAFAETIEVVSERYLEEAGAQDVEEAWVQDSGLARMAIVKVQFQRDYLNDPLSEARTDDKQDDVAKYKLLRDRYARGEYSRQDADFEEMVSLQKSLTDSDEIDVWESLALENIDLDCFRFSSRVRSLERIYQSPWMSEDLSYTRDEVREKFPYIPGIGPDGQPDGTWKGIHPDDLSAAMVYDGSGKMKDDERPAKIRKQDPNGCNVPVRDQKGDDELLVRQVYSLSQRKITILVEGVPYPAREWNPKRTPEQFYPFVVMVPNRVYGRAYGVPDFELIRDLQHRMNRKWTDDEKMREHAKPRGVYNTAGIDNGEATKLTDIPVGQLKGINLAGKDDISKVISWFQVPYSAEWCNTQQDEMNFQRMASQPPSLSGVVGQAKFSSEVQSGMEGLQVTSNFRQKRVRRSRERLRTVVAEILLQELSIDAVRQIAGPDAVWPLIYSDSDAKKLTLQITAAAKQEVGTQMASAVQMATQASAAGDPSQMLAVQQQFERQVAETVAKNCEKAFGTPEPMTREALFRRLRCHVRVSMAASQDRDQRIASLLKVFEALGEAAQACQAAGMRFNPRPFLRVAATILDCEDELDEMFDADPNAMVAALMDSLKEDAAQLTPEAANALVAMAAQVATQVAQAAGAQQANGQPVTAAPAAAPPGSPAPAAPMGSAAAPAAAQPPAGPPPTPQQQPPGAGA